MPRFFVRIIATTPPGLRRCNGPCNGFRARMVCQNCFPPFPRAKWSAHCAICRSFGPASASYAKAMRGWNAMRPRRRRHVKRFNDFQ